MTVGKVALVTGMTRTMGIAIGRRLVADGFAVLGCGRSERPGREAAAELSTEGGRAEFFTCDLTDPEQVAQAVKAAAETFGRLDVVVNNAAAIDVIRDGEELPVAEESLEAFLHTFKVGVIAPFLIAKAALPLMVAQGSGTFVHISSIAAVKAMPGMTGYGPSKAALESLSNQIAVDYGAAGIRSNCVRVNTIIVEGNEFLFEHPIVGPMLRRNQMIDRTGLPEDVAACVSWLASEDSAFTTGSSIPVDGGSGSKQLTPVLADLYG